MNTDHTFKRGDDWQAAIGYTFEPGGLTFDLTDTDRWLVEGQLRLKASADEIAAVLEFAPAYLAQSACLPRLQRASSVLLIPKKTYVGDIQVTDLTGPYGRTSTATFTVYIEPDVTRVGAEPVSVHIEPAEPPDVDDGDLWLDTSALPATPLVYVRVDGAWALMSAA